MSQSTAAGPVLNWQDLAAGGPSAPPVQISHVKTLVYKKSSRWEVLLKTSRYLSQQDAARMEQRLQAIFPDLSAISVRCMPPISILNEPAELDRLIEDILGILIQEMPSLLPHASQMSFRWAQEVLYITVRSQASLELCRHKGLEAWLMGWLHRTFDCPVSVRLMLAERTEEREEDYFALKNKEEQRLVQAAVGGIFGCGKKQDANGDPVAFEPEILLGRTFRDKPVQMDTLREDSGRLTVEGVIFDITSRELRGGKHIILADITDYTSSVTVKLFADADKAKELQKKLKKDAWVQVKGECQYDKYQKEVVLIGEHIRRAPPRLRLDHAPVKRVELHLHTQMSAMDGTASIGALIDRAAQWGHSALAVTDHGVVQAFPEAYALAQKRKLKVLLGVEIYLINDLKPMIDHADERDFCSTLVVLDIETTGLNAHLDEIIEIGAVKLEGGLLTDTFHSFIKPKGSIPPQITKLTGIDSAMTADAPDIEAVLPRFLAFCGDAALAAHNAPFDLGFLREQAKALGLSVRGPVLDTLALARELLPDLKRHKLKLVADHLGIPMKKHHRALEDAETAAQILKRFLVMFQEKGLHTLADINDAFGRMTNLTGLENHHAVLLVQNARGLKNLYTLISESHLNYYFRKPRIPKSLLIKHREGLLAGSGCDGGELYRGLLKGQTEEEILEIARFYDYLEIQPVANSAYLLTEGQVQNEEALRDINRKICALGQRMNRPVAATGDVHFLDPQDEVFRRILMKGQGFEDADRQATLYFKTTEEMLEEFSYLGEEEARRVVIEVPQAIADSIENLEPIPSRLCPPEIPGTEEEITRLARETAVSIYGDPLPEPVEKRLAKELNSIITNGFAVLYYIAHKLVQKSLSDGYLVGSRGSVGSSFAAAMTGITEVNPLPPHYICSECKHSDFTVDAGRYGCGADLPDKTCPKCGTLYRKDGYDIPFEVFLGFKGDKVPDIDLNFSGEYQSIAHKYTEELFGEGYVFRAGTIGTIAEKTAFGFVKKYLEEKALVRSNAEIKRLVAGCTGVKRTTGQHPGGILVLPKSRSIYEFTPIQHPADDKDSGTITSHFDFHAIHDTLVKLDILGHDDPTVIRMLEDLTGLDARTIPIGEKKTMALFYSTEPLDVRPEDIGSPVGTYGVPEFGTKFVRQMLLDTMPSTFAELIRISGLSHGTDVWLNNAQELVRNGTGTLKEVISTRDDIMVYLIYQGLEPTAAFNIMESVRKGKGVNPEQVQIMHEKGVPDWYIGSCNKIKYMFPKAHAAAYVIMAFRIAYFKVYHPEAFYAAYFTVRADDFDAALMLGGQTSLKGHIQAFEQKGNDLSAKERNVLTILEVVLEMNVRGIRFLPIDLYASHATRFLLEAGEIRPPLNALQGVGSNAAAAILEAREAGEFLSVEEFRTRTRVTKTVIETLKSHGVFRNLPETSQISLFSLAPNAF